MTSALANDRGSCAAFAAIALSVAGDVGVRLEAQIREDHVVVSSQTSHGYYELLQDGRFYPWQRKDVRTTHHRHQWIQVSGDSFLGYYLDNLAVRLTAEGAVDRAESAFTLAVNAAPRAARIRFNYGTFLLNGKHATEAVEQLRRAVRLDDHNVDAWTNLGVAYAQTGDEVHARRSFNKALHIDPRNANARRNLDVIRPDVGVSSAPPPR